LNQRLGIDLPTNDRYTTLAGFLLEEFRRIPKEGDTFNYKGHKLVVKKMSKRFIALIWVEIRQEKK